MNNNKNYNIYDILYISDEDEKEEKKINNNIKKNNYTKEKKLLLCLENNRKNFEKNKNNKINIFTEKINNKKNNIIEKNLFLINDKKLKYDREKYYNHKRISQEYLSLKKPVHFT